jgi:trehalose synthase
MNAAEFPADDYDFVIVHDPQPVAMIDHFPSRSAKWIWRGHIDFSTPNAEVFDVLLPSIRRYDAAIFHLREYVPQTGGLPTTFIWPPAIDPLTPKNMALSAEDAKYIVDQFGVDVSRPLMTQVSRFDPWKDPLGVIDAYRLARDEVPGLQLVMAGSMAADDPEGMEYLTQTRVHAGPDPDIHLLTEAEGVLAPEVNAFQQGADVVIQKSTREGFGLVVAEGMWKRRPVIGGNVGGITLQIEDGVSGFLVDSPAACAARLVELLRDPELRDRIGEAARLRVRDRFLSLREVQDYLRIFGEAVGASAARSA